MSAFFNPAVVLAHARAALAARPHVGQQETRSAGLHSAADGDASGEERLAHGERRGVQDQKAAADCAREQSSAAGEGP